jgi:peptidoglycan hydrolase CwlO-like protein
MQKLFFIYIFLLFQLFIFASVKAESIQDLVDDIKDIQNEIKSLTSGISDEAKIIDQSIKEINKAANFALEKIKSEDLDSAKAALAYSTKSIGDVGKVIPKEFESDMSNADIESFAPEKMETLKTITTAMAEKKLENNNLLLDQIIDLDEAGFNTTSMTSNLASLGINTVTMIELDNRKFDKIKNEIIENQSEISKKQENIKQLEDQIDPLESQIRSLENKKQ